MEVPYSEVATQESKLFVVSRPKRILLAAMRTEAKTHSIVYKYKMEVPYSEAATQKNKVASPQKPIFSCIVVVVVVAVVVVVVPWGMNGNYVKQATSTKEKIRALLTHGLKSHGVDHNARKDKDASESLENFGDKKWHSNLRRWPHAWWNLQSTSQFFFAAMRTEAKTHTKCTNTNWKYHTEAATQESTLFVASPQKRIFSCLNENRGKDTHHSVEIQNGSTILWGGHPGE